MKIPCYYALSCIDYKFGYITTCPRQTDRLMRSEYIPSKIINSENFKNLRLDLNKGNWPKGCWSCKESEENNVSSMRQDFKFLSNNMFDKQEGPFSILNYFDSSTGEMDLDGIQHVELRLSKACNFTCLHCSTAYSSGWINLLKKYTPDELDVKHQLHQLFSPGADEEIRYTSDQYFKIIHDLNNNFKNISKIQFAGGELLYQKDFFKVLEMLSFHPNADNIELTFHTNFNADFDVKKLSDLLSNFKKSIIIISIDGGENIYSFFRSGRWNKLESNIQIFKNENNSSELLGSCTTSIYQIMDIENIILSFSKLNLDAFNASIVQVPRYLNPSLLNHNFRSYVEDDIEKSYSHVGEIMSLKTTLDYIKNYVTNNLFDIKYFNAFQVYNTKMEKLMNKYFNDSFTKYKFIDNKLVRNAN